MSERRYKLGETKMRAPAILKAGLLATLFCARTEKGPKGGGASYVSDFILRCETISGGRKRGEDRRRGMMHAHRAV